MENKNIWISTASELLEIQNKIKFLKAKQEVTAKILKSLSGDDGLAVEGYKYAPSTRKGSVAYKNIPELKSIDLDQYRGKEVTVWKLTFTKQFNI